MTSQFLKIGELAKRVGCPVETVRFYEQKGLLGKPARSTGNYRLYGAAQLEQLRFIRHCRSLDMTLDEIRHLLDVRDAPDENCSAVNAMVDQHLAHVAARIQELQALQTQLENLRGRCHSVQSAKDCEILQVCRRARVGMRGSSPPEAQSQREPQLLLHCPLASLHDFSECLASVVTQVMCLDTANIWGPELERLLDAGFAIGS